MGLHRDGSHHGIRPVDTEIRRRIWAQLRMLDLRTAEELGCEPTIVEGSHDTILPLDVSDDILSQPDQTTPGIDYPFRSNQNEFGFQTCMGSIDPLYSSEVNGHLPYDNQAHETPELRRHFQTNYLVSPVKHKQQGLEDPQTKHVFSEMTFSLIRYEAVGLFNRLLSPKYRQKIVSAYSDLDIYKTRAESTSLGKTIPKPTSEEKDLWIDRLEQKFENLYRIHEWDLNKPIQNLTASVARLLIAKARLIVQHQQWKASQDMSSSADVGERTRYLPSLHSLHVTQTSTKSKTDSSKTPPPSLNKWLLL